MASFDSLREEIHEVFQIFDEEESGTITIAELTRALYTITGERISRTELLKLVASARETLTNQRNGQFQAQQKQSGHQASGNDDEGTGGSTSLGAGGTHAIRNESGASSSESAASRGMGSEGKSETPPRGSMSSSWRSSRQQQQHDNTDGIDSELFEAVVLRKLNTRSYDDELTFAFALLEDKYYPGFITKESLKRAALAHDEPLTDAEVNEMFDQMVTGVPTAAADFSTFCAIQENARSMIDS